MLPVRNCFRAQVTYITQILCLRKSSVAQRVATSPFEFRDVHRMLVDVDGGDLAIMHADHTVRDRRDRGIRGFRSDELFRAVLQK